MNQIELFIDGAAKGNPGHAGIGVVVCRQGAVLENISVYIGEATNNVAEYTALIYGLKAALALKASQLKVCSDSELLCRQINKIYKVKHPNLIALYSQAVKLLSEFKAYTVTHIPREQNIGADALANLAVKEALKKKHS